jgi:hypothetical protein
MAVALSSSLFTAEQHPIERQKAQAGTHVGTKGFGGGSSAPNSPILPRRPASACSPLDESLRPRQTERRPASTASPATSPAVQPAVPEERPLPLQHQGGAGPTVAAAEASGLQDSVVGEEEDQRLCDTWAGRRNRSPQFGRGGRDEDMDEVLSNSYAGIWHRPPQFGDAADKDEE